MTTETWITVELPILRWCAEHPNADKLDPAESMPDIDQAVIDRAIGRLYDAEHLTGTRTWGPDLLRPRLTESGLRAVGVWPPEAVGVAPLERLRHFPDDQARSTVLRAVEALLDVLAEYRDPERTPLDPDEWAQLDVSCETLETQLRHPNGNPIIVSAAADDALAAVRPHLNLEDGTSPEALDLLEVAEGIGNEDPVEAGDHAEAVLNRAVKTPPPESPDDETETEKFTVRARERAQDAALKGIDTGVEEAVRKLITGTPVAISSAMQALALWALAGGQGAAVGVAWAIIRIVIGSFKRRPG